MNAEKFELIRQFHREENGFGQNAMKNAKICAACGEVSSIQASFCSACGSQLPRESVFEQYKRHHAYCGHCDLVVGSETIFCPRCGRKIQEKGVDSNGTL